MVPICPATVTDFTVFSHLFNRTERSSMIDVDNMVVTDDITRRGIAVANVRFFPAAAAAVLASGCCSVQIPEIMIDA